MFSATSFRSYLINTEYTYIHAAVMIYVLEGTPPERIYQVSATDPENAELKVSYIKEKIPRYYIIHCI